MLIWCAVCGGSRPISSCRIFCKKPSSSCNSDQSTFPPPVSADSTRRRTCALSVPVHVRFVNAGSLLRTNAISCSSVKRRFFAGAAFDRGAGAGTSLACDAAYSRKACAVTECTASAIRILPDILQTEVLTARSRERRALFEIPSEVPTTSLSSTPPRSQPNAALPECLEMNV